MKTDPNYRQGMPDLIILYEDTWFALENKRSSKASHRPNQDYYVKLLDNMSFARFVSPDNEEEVLNEIKQTFGSTGKAKRTTRNTKRKSALLA